MQQGLEKWVNPYFQNLAKLGIKGRIRLVDTTQFINRITNFDFDMMVGTWTASSSTRRPSRAWSTPSLTG